MTIGGSADSLARLLVRHAVARLRRSHPDWADAMVREAAVVAAQPDGFRWALGCVIASYRAPGGLDPLAYPLALAGGATLLTTYEWRADESLVTVLLLGVIALALGLLRPKHWLLTGLTIGSVVAGVQAFEAVSGVYPTYETHKDLWRGVYWLMLLAPALFAAVSGRYARRLVDAVRLLG